MAHPARIWGSIVTATLNDLALMAATSCLISVAIFARWAAGTWCTPAAFMGGIWVVAAVPAAFIPEDGLSPVAFVFCSMFVLVFSSGSLAGECLYRPRGGGGAETAKNKKLRLVFGAPYLVAWVGVLGGCGLAAAVTYILMSNELPQSVFDLQGWLRIPAQYSIARYHEDFLEPLPLRILLALNYAGAMLGGILLAVEASARRRRVGAIPVVAGVLITLVTTAKAPLLICALGSLAGYLAARQCFGAARSRRGGWITLVRPVLLVVGLASTVVGSLTLRYGVEGDIDVATIAERLVGYVFGHMYALSAWLGTVGPWGDQLLFGQFTFAGLFEALGIAHRDVTGLYDAIPLNAMSADTNVFTALRGLVEDWSLPGGLLFVLGLGVGAGIAGRIARARSANVGTITSLVALYVFAAWTPIISIYAYNVVIMSIGIVAIVLWGARRSSEKSGVPDDACRTQEEICR